MLTKRVLFGLLPAAVVATALVLSPLEVVTEAQQQTPAGSAPAATGRAGGRGLGGGRGGPTMKPSALRAVPAETTAAKVKDPNWKAPRTAWGHPDIDGIWTSDDMRGIPTSRPPAMGTRESMTPEEFARRAGGDESSRDRAVNQLYEYSCHEGNGAVGYALSGERACEQMVDEAKAKGLPIPPRTMGMEVYSGGQVEGRQPVRELGGAR